jgi:hypothetical protein
VPSSKPSPVSSILRKPQWVLKKPFGLHATLFSYSIPFHLSIYLLLLHSTFGHVLILVLREGVLSHPTLACEDTIRDGSELILCYFVPNFVLVSDAVLYDTCWRRFAAQ